MPQVATKTHTGLMKHLLAISAACLALAACSHDPGALEASDSPVARYDWAEDSGMQALLEGTLEIRDGCLVVNPSWDDADTVVVPIFPRSYASWDADRNVLSYAGRDYALGDSIWAAGGHVSLPDDAVVPPSCPTRGGEEPFLIQSHSLEPPEG